MLAVVFFPPRRNPAHTAEVAKFRFESPRSGGASPAVMPTPGEIPYAAAKAGVNNLTVAFARALAPKVRVNCIMPGPFGTDISKAWSREALEGLGRGSRSLAAAPHEIVGAALSFALRPEPARVRAASRSAPAPRPVLRIRPGVDARFARLRKENEQ